MTEQYEGEEKRHLPRTPVSDITYNKFGIRTSVKASSVSVATTLTTVAKSNPNRISLILCNNSAAVVYVNFTRDLSSDFSLILSANGGTFDMNLNDEGEAVTAEIFAKGASGGQYVTVIETIVGGG